MEKKVYELKISEALERVMPPLQELELKLLTNSLLTEGCRDPLVVWDGVIVDGHNRYRICVENNIPFSYVEMEFKDEAAARIWIIKNQLSRRNVPDFVRCEMVLPLEPELRAEGKKRQGWRKAGADVLPNLVEGKGKTTQQTLAELAGVSHGNLDKARKLIEGADDETKELLRAGQLSIHKAYTDMKEKEKGEAPRETTVPPFDATEDNGRTYYRETTAPSEPRLLGTGPLPGQLPEGATYRMPDSVYDIPPIEVYGNMPADDMKLRGNVEMVHAKSDLQNSTENYVRRVSDILRGMTAASVNEENIQILREIVDGAYDQIIDMFNRKLGGEENE